MSPMSQPVLVTGGAGFIGSNFILHWLASEKKPLINLDKLTYAGNPANLASVSRNPRYTFIRGDVLDTALVSGTLSAYRPSAIIHFAAETHVDRSIHDAREFVLTNVEGTFNLLQAARQYLESLPAGARADFRFIHISTDEVYGSLQPREDAFTESRPYSPNSPYAASKAGADHLVRAFCRTYDFPAIIANPSNTYGPFQFPEKLIPLMILNAVAGTHMPVYGDGQNVRDWLFVDDHCDAIGQVLAKGRTGQAYNIGGNCEKANIDVVREICEILSELRPGPDYLSLIRMVKDRPGHDRRYAVNTSKFTAETGWYPRQTFSSGLRKTVRWYLDNLQWVQSVSSGAYREWISLQYPIQTSEGS